MGPWCQELLTENACARSLGLICKGHLRSVAGPSLVGRRQGQLETTICRWFQGLEGHSVFQRQARQFWPQSRASMPWRPFSDGTVKVRPAGARNCPTVIHGFTSLQKRVLKPKGREEQAPGAQIPFWSACSRGWSGDKSFWLCIRYCKKGGQKPVPVLILPSDLGFVPSRWVPQQDCHHD